MIMLIKKIIFSLYLMVTITIFYLIFFPISFILKLFNKKYSLNKLNNDKKTYWNNLQKK